jgi:hypothetical protein
VLPLDVCVFFGSLCCTWTCLVYSSLEAPGRGYSTAACAAPAWTCHFYSSLYCPWTCLCVCSTEQQSLLSQEMSGLQQLVLHQDVYLFNSSLCCVKKSMVHSTAVCAAHGVFIYKSLCAAPGRICLVSTTACVALERVCLQELCAHLDASVYKSQCCTCACLSAVQELCAAPGLVCL